MDVLRTIIDALWQQDFSVLSNPEVAWMLYGVMFIILFLENGLLPVSFLPGDSLLILAGALITKGVMEFIPTLAILTLASCLGCWLSYIQGRWLSNAPIIKKWLMHLPAQYHQRAWKLFDRHGLAALLIGRFLAFIRTLLPIMAGMSGLKNARFQFFNWLSGLLWVSIMVTLGYAINMIPLIRRYENQVMTILMILPFVLLCIGLAGSLLLLWQRKSQVRSGTKK